MAVKEKLMKLLLVVPVLAVLFLVPAMTAVSVLPGSPLKPAAGYSIYENRSLASVPVLNGETFWSGAYFSGWEDCLSDRFYGRDAWLKAYTAFEMLRGRASVNSVVMTDEVLLPQNPIPDYSARAYAAEAAQMAAELHAIEAQVSGYGGTLLYVGVPEQRSLFRDVYPAWQEDNAVHLEHTETAFRQAMEAAGVPLLLMRPQFASAEDPGTVYSTVDHHYNLLGAYETYRAVCDVLLEQGWEFPVVTEEHIEFSQLPNPFLGTYNRKLYGLSPVSEKLWVYASDLAVPFTRTDNGAPSEPSVLDLPESAWETVYYNLYMGGDQAETIVDTGRDDLPSVLIWGDSFTNAFEAIAWMSFDEMRSLDLRYYTDKTLSAYIDAYQPEIVLGIRDDLNYLSTLGKGTVR